MDTIPFPRLSDFHPPTIAKEQGCFALSGGRLGATHTPYAMAGHVQGTHTGAETAASQFLVMAPSGDEMLGPVHWGQTAPDPRTPSTPDLQPLSQGASASVLRQLHSQTLERRLTTNQPHPELVFDTTTYHSHQSTPSRTSAQQLCPPDNCAHRSLGGDPCGIHLWIHGVMESPIPGHLLVESFSSPPMRFKPPSPPRASSPPQTLVVSSLAGLTCPLFTDPSLSDPRGSYDPPSGVCISSPVPGLPHHGQRD
ncbi:hypothetical protein G7046_g7185 [Stylonectria norvegica]|nr:hypothetical protein G7046_g7185 [Stylonectria norvegica]